MGKLTEARQERDAALGAFSQLFQFMCGEYEEDPAEPWAYIVGTDNIKVIKKFITPEGYVKPKAGSDQ